MRVTQSSYYHNLDKNVTNTQHKLNAVNKQLASGRNIEYGYENPQAYNQAMRLDNDINSLTQARNIANRAVSFTDYTDNTLKDMKEVLDKFRVKLVAAANDSNASSSLLAIGDELRAYKDHLINLANAKGDGKYLFAGTALEKPPINAAGEYSGNDGQLKAHLGDNVQQTFNIPGSDLFLGSNGDVHRQISTNIQLFNQTLLHPEARIEGGVAEQAKEVVLTRFDKIRDMVGDDDANEFNDESTFFYIRGRRSDGFSFKQRFEMDSQANVSDLMDRIGEAFGNTPRSKIVDVSIDNAGFIEITDRKTGSSKIDFHMISTHEEVDSVDQLSELGAEIKAYNNSDFQGIRVNHMVSASNSQYDHRDFVVNTVLKDYEQQFATDYSLVRDVMPDVVDEIWLTGADIDGNVVAKNLRDRGTSFKVDDTTTMFDFLRFIEKSFGGEKQETRARLSDGRIMLADDSITAHEPSQMYLSMTSKADGDDIKGFTSLSELEYDRAYWEKDGSKLHSTVPQITRKTNERATEDTKLLDVAGAISLKGTGMEIQGRDVNGGPVDYTVFFQDDPGCAYFVDNKTGNEYDIMSHGKTTGGNDMTYRQLFDVIEMIMSGHIPTSANPTYMEDYLIANSNAQDMVEVSFDQGGKIVIRDRLQSITDMEFSIYDRESGDFCEERDGHPIMTFHANNSITIDDPKTDFFALIDGAIKSVDLERKRADGESINDPRNIGVQNSIVSLEHLMEHVTNQHSRIGAQSNSIRYAQERNEAWIVHAKTVRSDVIDTDLAEASMKYQQLTNNYQAMLSTASKVKQLGLVNYL
jgi:flagellar hook-associated protein 3 FlgL